MTPGGARSVAPCEPSRNGGIPDPRRNILDRNAAGSDLGVAGNVEGRQQASRAFRSATAPPCGKGRRLRHGQSRAAGKASVWARRYQPIGEKRRLSRKSCPKPGNRPPAGFGRGAERHVLYDRAADDDRRDIERNASRDSRDGQLGKPPDEPVGRIGDFHRLRRPAAEGAIEVELSRLGRSRKGRRRPEHQLQRSGNTRWSVWRTMRKDRLVDQQAFTGERECAFAPPSGRRRLAFRQRLAGDVLDKLADDIRAGIGKATRSVDRQHTVSRDIRRPPRRAHVRLQSDRPIVEPPTGGKQEGHHRVPVAVAAFGTPRAGERTRIDRRGHAGKLH